MKDLPFTPDQTGAFTLHAFGSQHPYIDPEDQQEEPLNLVSQTLHW